MTVPVCSLQGFPGNVNATVHYTLTEDNEFKIEFTAATDEATPINMAQHSYFNLNGALTGTTALNNILTINGCGTPWLACTLHPASLCNCYGEATSMQAAPWPTQQSVCSTFRHLVTQCCDPFVWQTTGLAEQT